MMDKTARGSSSQFFVAGELCRRGYSAVVTLGNTPNTDVLCSNLAGTRFVHIQVKTFRPGDRTCSVGAKAERVYSDSFYWILAGIPEQDTKNDFRYFIIPCSVMAKNVSEIHRIWLQAPGKSGQAHNDTKVRAVHLPPRQNINGWSLHEFENRWDLIKSQLDD